MKATATVKKRQRYTLRNPGPFLDEALAFLTGATAEDAPATGACLSEVAIARLAERSATPEERQAADAHLRICSRCCNLLMQVHRLSAEAAVRAPVPRVIRFPEVRHFGRGAAPTEADIPHKLAAQAFTLGPPTWEVLQAGDARVLLSVGRGDTARALVELNGEPLGNARVTLEAVNAAGRVTRRITRRTTREGEARFGPLARLPKAEEGGRLRVDVEPAQSKTRRRRS